MGKPKSKTAEPEPKKIVRVGKNVSIPLTDEEKKYRNKNGPDDVTDIPRDKLKCTVCTKSVLDIVKKAADPYVHTVLEVLMCKDCASFYGDGYFSTDEDGDDKYCRWCGQGGTLYLCSACTCAFCKKCLKQNLDRKDVKEVESDDWKCLICNPKPLFECRTVCWTLQENAKKHKENDEENENQSRKSSRSSKTDQEDTRKKRKSSELSEEEFESFNKNKRRKSEVQSKKITPLENDEKTEKRGVRKRTPSPKTISPKKSSRLSLRDTKPKQFEEVILSDSDDEKLKSPKKKPKSSKKEVSKSVKSVAKEQEKPSRPKRSLPLKTSLAIEEAKPIRSPRRSISHVNLKKSTSVTTTPLRKSKKKLLSKNEDDEDCQTTALVSLQDDNSSSESESTVKQGKLQKKLLKTKLKVQKNADTNVVKACKYIDSAVKDVLELTVLISNRCEKLCSKTVKVNDDVLSVFGKLQQLMHGVHTNLELIERGVTGKINEWRGQKTTDETAEKCIPDEIDENPVEDNKPEIVDLSDTEQTGGECKSEQIKETCMEVDEPILEKGSEEQIDSETKNIQPSDSKTEGGLESNQNDEVLENKIPQSEDKVMSNSKTEEKVESNETGEKISESDEKEISNNVPKDETNSIEDTDKSTDHINSSSSSNVGENSIVDTSSDPQKSLSPLNELENKNKSFDDNTMKVEVDITNIEKSDDESKQEEAGDEVKDETDRLKEVENDVTNTVENNREEDSFNEQTSDNVGRQNSHDKQIEKNESDQIYDSNKIDEPTITENEDKRPIPDENKEEELKEINNEVFNLNEDEFDDLFTDSDQLQAMDSEEKIRNNVQEENDLKTPEENDSHTNGVKESYCTNAMNNSKISLDDKCSDKKDQVVENLGNLKDTESPPILDNTDSQVTSDKNDAKTEDIKMTTNPESLKEEILETNENKSVEPPKQKLETPKSQLIDDRKPPGSAGPYTPDSSSKYQGSDDRGRYRSDDRNRDRNWDRDHNRHRGGYGGYQQRGGGSSYNRSYNDRYRGGWGGYHR